MIEIVAITDMRGAAMPAPVMRDHTIAFREEDRPKGSHGQGASNAGCEPPQPPLPNGSISHRGWPVLTWTQCRARPFSRSRRRSRFRAHYQPVRLKRALLVRRIAPPHRESPGDRGRAEAARLGTFASRAATSIVGADGIDNVGLAKAPLSSTPSWTRRWSRCAPRSRTRR